MSLASSLNKSVSSLLGNSQDFDRLSPIKILPPVPLEATPPSPLSSPAASSSHKEHAAHFHAIQPPSVQPVSAAACSPADTPLQELVNTVADSNAVVSQSYECGIASQPALQTVPQQVASIAAPSTLPAAHRHTPQLEQAILSLSSPPTQPLPAAVTETSQTSDVPLETNTQLRGQLDALPKERDMSTVLQAQQQLVWHTEPVSTHAAAVPFAQMKAATASEQQPLQQAGLSHAHYYGEQYSSDAYYGGYYQDRAAGYAEHYYPEYNQLPYRTPYYPPPHPHYYHHGYYDDSYDPHYHYAAHPPAQGYYDYHQYTTPQQPPPAEQPPFVPADASSIYPVEQDLAHFEVGQTFVESPDAWVDRPQQQQAEVGEVTQPDFSDEAEQYSGGQAYAANIEEYPLESGWGPIEATPPSPARETPELFVSPHVRSSFSASGQLVTVLPMAAIVELASLRDCLHDPETTAFVAQVEASPGPLLVGETPKSQVVQFAVRSAEICRQKSTQELESSEEWKRCEEEAMLWDFLALMCQQNGVLLASDVSELLIKEQPLSFQCASHLGSINLQPALDALRLLLMSGRRKEALDLACSKSLWGHALMLASRMDEQSRTYVVNRFTASLMTTDPLSTFYTLLLDRSPSVLKPDGLSRAGDWRPHLAVMLANSSSRRDQTSIRSLGDSLRVRGRLAAAHLCYHLADVSFGPYGSVEARYSLLGVDHSQLHVGCYPKPAQLERMEVLEYAVSLSKHDFSLPHFQTYKLLHVLKLTEAGFLAKALKYCEQISYSVVKKPHKYSQLFLHWLVELCVRLQHSGSPFTLADSELPSWLQHLQQAAMDTLSADYTPSSNIHSPSPAFSSVSQALPRPPLFGLLNVPRGVGEPPLSVNSSCDEGSLSNMPFTVVGQLQQQEEPGGGEPHFTLHNSDEPDAVSGEPTIDSSAVQYQTTVDATAVIHTRTVQQLATPTYYQPSDWHQQQQLPDWHQQQPAFQGADTEPVTVSEVPEAPPIPVHVVSTSENEQEIKSNNAQQATPTQAEGSGDSHVTQPADADSAKESVSSEQRRQQDEAGSGEGRWWGRRIIDSLIPKKKNQAHLPEDRDKRIVYDEQSKRWVNLDADESDQAGPAAPPTDAELRSQPVSRPLPPSSQEDAPTAHNMFSQQARRKGARSKYVDVLNPGGSVSSTEVAPPPLIMTAAGGQTFTGCLFVPQQPVASGSGGQSAAELLVSGGQQGLSDVDTQSSQQYSQQHYQHEQQLSGEQPFADRGEIANEDQQSHQPSITSQEGAEQMTAQPNEPPTQYATNSEPMLQPQFFNPSAFAPVSVLAGVPAEFTEPRDDTLSTVSTMSELSQEVSRYMSKPPLPPGGITSSAGYHRLRQGIRGIRGYPQHTAGQLPHN